MSDKNDTKTNPVEDTEVRDEKSAKKAEKGNATTENLEGGKSAKDALDVKKNVVGPNRDDEGPDNSPTTNDVFQDTDELLQDSREEGFRNGREEHPQK